MGDILHTIFYAPIYNLLIIFYQFFGENLGLAIIAIALVARTLMIPLTARQIKMAEMNREFSEKVKDVKKKHKKNKEKQQQELMKLQSEYLPAQLGGCLPMIFQFIFFIYIYNVIRNIINEGIDGFREVAYSFAPHFASDYHINLSFFGIVNLGDSANKIGLSNMPDVLPYIIIVILVGISQYLSTKILSAMRTKKAAKLDTKKKDDKKPDDFGEIMQQSTKQAMLLMPLLITFIAFSLPSGVGIYWITQSTFVILQQFVFDKLNIYQTKGSQEESKKDKN